MKHYIIVKFKSDINWKEKVSDIEKIFQPSLNIEGVNSFNILKSNSDKDNRYDIMIKMDLSEQGLLNFDSSEVHSLWKSEFGDLIFNKVIFDCE